MQPAGDFITPGPTKLGRTRQLCSSAQSAGAWLLSWKLVAEGPLPWQLAGVTVATVSVELAAAWLLQLVGCGGGCSLAGCGPLAPTGFGLATNFGAGLLAFGASGTAFGGLGTG